MIGVDADDLVGRFEAGEALETLPARPLLPESSGPFDMLRF